jgi:hypothetical protein
MSTETTLEVAMINVAAVILSKKGEDTQGNLPLKIWENTKFWMVCGLD